MTFQNLSAPFTVDCVGAYIAIERENNGFEAKWCGNRVSQGGSRPYVIFARNEVRVTVFDDGSEGKTLPTGFNGDVEGKRSTCNPTVTEFTKNVSCLQSLICSMPGSSARCGRPTVTATWGLWRASPSSDLLQLLTVLNTIHIIQTMTSSFSRLSNAPVSDWLWLKR